MLKFVSKITAEIGSKWVSFKWKVGNKLFARYRRMKLKNKNFSIICNNCVAGGIYQKLGLPYNTPTIGLFFPSDDYINFLEKFKYYIKQPLEFKNTSRHNKASEFLKTHFYPVGVLGDKIEIHFLHYENEKMAKDAWNRRKERINFDNLFFIYSDREEDFQDEFLDRYSKLSFNHKIFLSLQPRKNNKIVISIQSNTDDPKVVARAEYEKYFDIIKWLNGDDDFIKKHY